jgi:predicted metallo-beta-lactamase superfamily hydrolase
MVNYRQQKPKQMEVKLNPNKCVFEVPSGQLLGFLVSNQEIEVSTKQIRAIIEMRPLCCVKDVQN